MLEHDLGRNGVRETFFEWLQERCRSKRMNIGRLADALGIPRTTMYYHAHRPRELKVGLSTRISLVLNIPAIDILIAALDCRIGLPPTEE